MSEGRGVFVATAAVLGTIMALPIGVGNALARRRGASPPVAPPTLAQCRGAFGLACYSPLELQHAYDLQPLYATGFNGNGSTIVIVDLYGSSTIGRDLRTFDAAFGLPDPPALRVLEPVGPVPPFDRKSQAMLDKAGETTLDVEWAHAMAPGARILVVETPVIETARGGGFRQYMAAEDYVIRHNLGDVISQSFSLPEQNFGRGAIASLRRTYVNAARHRITALAATNDNGVSGPNVTGGMYRHPVVQWPATDPLVTAVGGTELQLNAAGSRLTPDIGWNDTWDPHLVNLFGQPPPLPWASSGGLSVVFRRPSYQTPARAIVGDRRGVPDVSMSASFSGGVLIYETFPGTPTWLIAGGTSEAAPEFAGIVAIAEQYAKRRLHKRRLGLINPALYALEHRHARGIVDVSRGNNTVTFATGRTNPAFITVRGYKARRGYDLVTGAGTIDAARFVPELAHAG